VAIAFLGTLVWFSGWIAQAVAKKRGRAVARDRSCADKHSEWPASAARASARAELPKNPADWWCGMAIALFRRLSAPYEQ
jgi:hypothetical protein